MTNAVLEPRSFEPAESAPRQERWTEEVQAFDSVASRALIHRVRWHTGLSQAEFAAAYRIDLDHLRELERGLVQPDSALVAYLAVIDRAPDLVRAALTTC
jgi:putative transcriptional regulator